MIINFYVATRIIVDVESDDELSEEEFSNAVDIAVEKMIDNGIDNYLNTGNVENIYEDTEMPYPQEFDI